MNSYQNVVNQLEKLSIMPKTMPGLEKIKQALKDTKWFLKIDPNKVIVVAGTNGKGSTCACLEGLLLNSNQKVGLYTSPHLVETTERIRIHGSNISKEQFIHTFEKNRSFIEKNQLTHFEALTLMAGDVFFEQENLDFVIFEVGLGGTYDATNAFPHTTSVITTLGLDHTNILGNSLVEIAKNKFGIVHHNNKVIHAPFGNELDYLKSEVQRETDSEWMQAASYSVEINKTQSQPKYFLNSVWGKAELSLLGERAAQNANLALTVFESLGFDPKKYLQVLNKIHWLGRMQKIEWSGISAPIYLSGDHNPEGIKSLLQILKDFNWKTLHLIVGIGVDKDAEEMLSELTQMPRAKLYLTETPFKGRKLDDYPEKFQQMAVKKNKDFKILLNQIALNGNKDDLIIVTGSLYLVGEVLKANGAP